MDQNVFHASFQLDQSAFSLTSKVDQPDFPNQATSACRNQERLYHINYMI